MMLPLTTANLLAQAIIGSVVENLDMERLIRGKLLERAAYADWLQRSARK
jgi:hypothetical protein